MKAPKKIYLLSFVVVCCRLSVASCGEGARRETCEGATKVRGGRGTQNGTRAGTGAKVQPKKPKNRGEVLEMTTPPLF